MDQGKTKPQTIYLKDYTPPAFLIPKIEMTFELFEERTIVTSQLTIQRNQKEEIPLRLNGEHQSLLSVRLNQNELSTSDYQVNDTYLTLSNVPEEFTLEVVSEIKPHENKALEGLYKSGDIFCTQNEPEGFRRITYFIDRPDVMSRYQVRIEADKTKYPLLLSNGNPIERGDLEGGRHFVVWEDPFPKPCYLFALVAGDLGMIEDSFTTCSGKKVPLQIFVDKGNESRATHAMESLKKAMQWDEERFGLEYDLGLFMIVAVDAFNMGAMENKGLNIFNSQFILASPETATDSDYDNILGVVGHEYFHNWTGNRVTCRDWFQLTLKEGLTVFRDEEFSSDMTSRAVKRLQDIRILREFQFTEDAGPMAHPIRPASYIEINNFYTVTVYQKGAAVIRMIQTLIGKENFRKGIDKYFELYDGQAVTTDDFLHAMEEVSGKDLTQFKNWYCQAGTPHLKIKTEYRANDQKYVLEVEQSCASTPESKTKEPFVIPLAFSLADPEKKELITLRGSKKELILEANQKKQTFGFANIPAKPVPSFLNDFSAPVVVEYDYRTSELLYLLKHAEDDFVRFEAGQTLANRELDKLIAAFQERREPHVHDNLIEAFAEMFFDEEVDPAFRAEAILMPSLTQLTERQDVCDFENSFKAREYLIRSFANKYEDKLLHVYESHFQKEYRYEPKAVAKRRLKNAALALLIAAGKKEAAEISYRQFQDSNNMTDTICALSLLCHTEFEERERALKEYEKKWLGNTLAMDKWLIAQAASKHPNVLSEIRSLEEHPAYDSKNPNRIRSLLGVFTRNFVPFHKETGEGYQFIADKVIEIDRFNPSISARLSQAFKKYAKLDQKRQQLMQEQLKRIQSTNNISKAVFEIVEKTLNSRK